MCARLLCFATFITLTINFNVDKLLELRKETKNAFFHSYHSYLKYGFPADETLPIECKARLHINKSRGVLDDVLGGYMLSLVDSLDTLLIMREYDEFNHALNLLKGLSLQNDVIVSVFETNIRMLGGLLSAHQLAKVLVPKVKYDMTFLLDQAEQIAIKMLPAFSTATGIPLHQINLKRGVTRGISTTTCPAAGGTFLMEMGTLSKLTGNYTYQRIATRALTSLWNRRSSLNLVGSLIDTNTGHWKAVHSGIGGGIDSYYETLLKSYILFGDERYFDWFNKAYISIKSNLVYKGYVVEGDMSVGMKKPFSYYISALQAFWPTLQILVGDVQEAADYFDSLYRIWSIYGALPDVFDVKANSTIEYGKDSPLRPEMVESAYHLYLATKSESYLAFGSHYLSLLQKVNRVKCGYAATADVHTKRLDDRMDSYFLAETLKYLYLLFDEGLPASERESLFCKGTPTVDSGDGEELAHADGCIEKREMVFSTEGHLFLVNEEMRDFAPHPVDRSTKKSTGGKSNQWTCSVYLPRLGKKSLIKEES